MEFVGGSVAFLVIEGTVSNRKAIATEGDSFLGAKVTVKNLVIFLFLLLSVLLV